MIYDNMIMPDSETGSEVINRSKPERKERRSGSDRRLFSYTGHIPERRSGVERRRSTQKRRLGARPQVGAWGLQRPPHLKE